MLLYRVFPYLESACRGEKGHPLYLKLPQGKGRHDNPPHYSTFYLAFDSPGAIGESFGNLRKWSEEMFEFPDLPGSRRSLGIYYLPDATPLLDLDDPKNLLDRGLRPTQVIERNRSATQQWALKVFRERNDSGDPLWSGVCWWSFHRPSWRVMSLWEHSQLKCMNVLELSVQHPAIKDASATLAKRIKKTPPRRLAAAAVGASGGAGAP